MCCFCVHSWAPDLIYPGTSLYEHILWMHLEKKRTYACTFPVQRKEINIVKVRFTMRYSSRKLSHEKVITTACNFWRQIACSFLVKSGNVLLLGKKFFEIPPFFQTRPGDLGEKVHACSLRFSALNIWDDWEDRDDPDDPDDPWKPGLGGQFQWGAAADVVRVYEIDYIFAF